QLTQEHQDGEGELQPSPVPEDIAGEAQVPSEPDGEKHQGDDGSDTTRSQNGRAAQLLLWSAAVRCLEIVHGSAILPWSGSPAGRLNEFPRSRKGPWCISGQPRRGLDQPVRACCNRPVDGTPPGHLVLSQPHDLRVADALA